jgi:hypothetical protein
MSVRFWFAVAVVGLGSNLACVGDSGNTPPTLDAATAPDSAKEASVDAGPFTPKALPKLHFWMDGSRGTTVSGGFVTAWADQSGAKNDASQSDPSRQPKLAANAIAGQTALEFPGNAMATNLDVGSPSKAFTGDFFVELVMTTSLGQGESGDVFDAGNPVGDNAQIRVANGKLNAGLVVGPASKFLEILTPISPGTAHVVFLRRQGTKFELGLDGATASVADAPTGALSALFRFGGPFLGYLAEVIGIDGTITADDQAALEKYLKSKYAL